MSRTFHSSLLAAAVLAGVFCSRASADVLAIRGHQDDFEPQKRSNTGEFFASQNNVTSRVGFQSNFNGSGTFAPGGITSVYFFPLPALNPGDTINSAQFSIGRLADTASTAVTPTFNADLYALGVVNQIDATTAAGEKFWYIQNSAQTSLPEVAGGPAVGGPVSLIQDNFLVPSDFIPNGSSNASTPNVSDATGSANLLAYLQNLYSDPAGNGFTPGTSYLVIRLSPDPESAPTSGTQRYMLAWEGTPTNGGGTTNDSLRPHLTLDVTFIPEPTSLALLGIGVIGLLARRRA